MSERAKRWEHRFNVPVLAAALLVIPVIIVEQSDVGEPWRTLAAILNWSIWLVFALELVTMLVVVSDRWHWLRTHPLEVIVVVLTPPFLPASLQAARALRLLRVLRVLRLMTVLRKLYTFEGLRYAALLAVMTALGGGAGFAAVEKGHNDAVTNTWDGVFWAVTTMTTVGYGDIYPMTDGGRLIAIGVMIVGIGFLSMLIAAGAERFVSKDVGAAQDRALAELGEVETDVLREIEEIAQRLRSVEASVRRIQGA
jgi:voltage-gated potassium channel